MNTVVVNILDKEYQVSCPEEEVEALTKSARYLDQKMSEIRSSGKVVGLDRIAVMAALNITNAFLNGQDTISETNDTLSDRITFLSEKVGSALAQHKQTDL
ncbi:MAG: cell division protein ZapA [Pseudomonadota bacterium]